MKSKPKKAHGPEANKTTIFKFKTRTKAKMFVEEAVKRERLVGKLTHIKSSARVKVKGSYEERRALLAWCISLGGHQCGGARV